MIKIDDVTDPRVIQLLETHMATMEKASPPGTCHYLDLDGLRAADVTFYSVWDSENVVAVGAVKKLDDTHGEIKSMHTSLNQRGKGTASRLLSHIIENAKKDGLSQLSLETGTSEEFGPAIALYKKFGFEFCPPFGSYSATEFNTYLTMKL